MAKTAHRKKTLTRKNFLKLLAEEKDQYTRYINMSRYYINDYVVTLTPYKAINKTVIANREPTVLFHSISNYDFFLLRMTGRGFTRSMDCTCWLGTESCRKLVTMKTLPYVIGTGPEINTM